MTVGSDTDKNAPRKVTGVGAVWDMTLPWLESQRDVRTLRRFYEAGFSFVSTTLQDFPPTMEGIRSGVADFSETIRGESWVRVVTSYNEIEESEARGQLAVGLNVQETVQLETDLSRVEQLHRLGILHMQLSYNTRNFVADGCAERADAGLSQFGRHVVKEMNRFGMVVDCSHVGCRSSLEAMDLTEFPPIFSHSGAYELCSHIRNLRDEQIHACANRRGVIGIPGIGGFIGDPLARAESVFRHIDYVAGLVGIEYVGLGFDYVQDMSSVWSAIRAQKDLAWPDPTGTQLTEGRSFEPEQLVELIRVMKAHGYSDPAVQCVLSENFRRVYRDHCRAKRGGTKAL
jgi:membrane dipeptidase